MSLKKFTLSFFNEHNIRYFINDDSSFAVYECLYCCKKANINLETTKWDCEHCKSIGDIGTLMKINTIIKSETSNTNEKKEFYNPRKEKNEVNYQFKKLVVKAKGTVLEKELSRIQIKIERLLEELIPKKVT